MTITIHTRLDDGIYASSGGGKDIVHYEWTTGPRNLMSAIAVLTEHRQSMTLGYGNIGCGGSWLEIDGEHIDHIDLDAIRDATAIREMDDRHDREWGRRSATATQESRSLLAELAGGTYGETRRRIGAEIEADYRAEYDAAVAAAEAEDALEVQS